ncbi:MAG: glutamine--tRNA ligase/YqeY domain fusion protein [Desulfarculus sp.]|nr:glutamine--tRNA ligase/YqeY domain fusion protein [Desulfarculus sp.]
MSTAEPVFSNFIRSIIDEDMANGKWAGRVATRFPPEPNGYLHIGHAKSICLNFGLANEYGGTCNLRFDDTNPSKEDVEYVDSIMDTVRWLGFDWQDRLYYASDYFEKLYQYAEALIQKGLAYVDDSTPEEIRAARGTLTEPGQHSPYRGRPTQENLDLFRRMRAGEFPDGSRVLRAKIDMASPNINLRDPTIYRIKHVHHHRTGDQWCIYPMYDYTHCISDALEGITHSICTLEFEDHRPLYDWCLDQLPVPCHPQQIEFARLNLEYTLMSKRKLLLLVQEGHVAGWDDPRMPTLVGLRRRGYTPGAIRAFCERIGVAKRDSLIPMELLEKAVRDDLNLTARRVMAVLDPIKVVIDNYPEGQVEHFEAPYFPDDPPAMGNRPVPFGRELYIEREDFMEEPPKKFWRLAPGREVRLRWAYFVTCTHVVKDDQGRITEVHCTYDPATKGGDAPDGRKVKGTIHWVSAAQSLLATVRLYDRLFTHANPAADKEHDWRQLINPESLKTLTWARLEPSLASAQPGEMFQFERKGFFCADLEEHAAGKPVFNRTVTLRDTWQKIVAADKGK